MSIIINKYDWHIQIVNGSLFLMMVLFNERLSENTIIKLMLIIASVSFIVYSILKLKNAKIIINGNQMTIDGKQEYDLTSLKSYQIGIFRSYINVGNDNRFVNFGMISRKSISLLKDEFEKRINGKIFQ